MNKLIKGAKCNNTGTKIVCGFNWAFDLFNGKKHNHKLIITRPKEISKFTTRLDLSQIQQIETNFQNWIKDVKRILLCKQENTKIAREKIYHCFKSLINSGMRVGELSSIDFTYECSNRIIENQFTEKKVVEIIINTEKTKKKREIYIPYESYEFFIKHKLKLNRVMIQCGFDVFKKWAKFSFKFTSHSLRRTFATSAYGLGIEIDSICMSLGNSHKVCCEHYILSSMRNFDTFEIVNGYHDGRIIKTGNLHLNKNYLKVKDKTDNLG